jgi:hypothetical protein
MPDEKDLRAEQPLRGLPTKQDPAAEPVILAPHLPAMEKVGAVKTVLRNTLLPLMGAGGMQSSGGQGTMAAVPARIEEPVALSGKAQEPKVIGESSAAGDGYVRLDVHVENGKLSLVGIKQVPGPLALPSTLIRGYAYEILLDAQQVALGSVPDVGVQRAFANRDVPDPQGKHFFIKVPTFDFAARIPRGYLVSANLPKLTVVLHNVEDAPDRFTTLAPLQQQTGVKTTEIGRMAGVSLENLPAAVRPALERIVNELDKAQ